MSRSKTSPKARHRKRQKQRSQAPNDQADIALALDHQRAGEVEQAKQIYCEVLRRNPECVDAWHLLGMALASVGQHDEAINCLKQAVGLLPDHPELLGNLGVVYRSAGDLVAAESTLRQAIHLAPEATGIRANLGTVLMEQGNLDAATTMFERVLRADRDHKLATMNLANIWQSQGRTRDAADAYVRLLGQHPHDALVAANLGEALRQLGAWAEAAESLSHALTLAPQQTETRLNLARTLMNLNQHAAAEKQLRDLIRQRSDWSKPYHYLGKMLLDIRQLPAARQAIEQALANDPTDLYAMNTLGFTHLEMGQHALATSCFERVVERDPTMHAAHSSLLFIKSGDPAIDQQALFEAHREWGQMHGSVEQFDHPARAVDDRRIRLGYLSPDFRNHAVSRYFEPVLVAHDRERFEVFCYGEVSAPDAATDRMMAQADHWRSTVGFSDQQVADMLQADGIDVAIDLAGHTAWNRLKALAYRPAPVQMTWLGYPNTTGLEAIDYRITCSIQDPPDQPTYHTEQLLRLPVGSFCFAPPAGAPDVSTSPFVSKGSITFGSLHRPFKISEKVRTLWAEVLKACPASRLILFNTRFNDESMAAFRQSFLHAGIDRSRFEIRNDAGQNGYLATYDEIDISLDVAPWAGGTTTLESLWMGVPVLALCGDQRAARSTAAIMHHVGLGDWVADKVDNYAELATTKSADVSSLVALRRELRGMVQSTLADADRFTRELEKAFQSAVVGR